jgi:hypothetical protein
MASADKYGPMSTWTKKPSELEAPSAWDFCWPSGNREYVVRMWRDLPDEEYSLYLFVKVEGRRSDMHAYPPDLLQAMNLAERWDTMTETQIREEIPELRWSSGIAAPGDDD